MAKIVISDLNFAEISTIHDVTDQELEEVSGGILCLLIIAFGAGYGIGCLIR